MLDQTSLDLLKRIGLSDKQASIYLALLQLGSATAAQIAELSGLKRSITYVLLDTLIAKGYAQLVPNKTKQTYSATDPNMLASELENTAKDFNQMLPYLRSMQRKAGKPYVSYYNGIEGARRAFSQIRRPKEARYAVSIDKAMKRVPQEIERWKTTYLKGKARPGGRHLLTNTIEDKTYGDILKESQQIVRYMKKNQELNMDLALVDNRAYLTAFDNEIHVTVIESEALYRSLCALYDLAWEGSRSGSK
jgi:sugar-specific transcriptional regulator TrmB